jgi:hypothetical protein
VDGKLLAKDLDYPADKFEAILDDLFKACFMVQTWSEM